MVHYQLGILETWRTRRLFNLYVNMVLVAARSDLSPKGAATLSRVEQILMNKKLPEKVRFYRSVGCPRDFRDLYRNNFLSV